MRGSPLVIAVFVFLGLLGLGQAQAAPAQVLLIRHGEKPPQGNDLSARGWQRAQALPELFQRPEFEQYGLPVALYAMAPKGGLSNPQSSMRAVETLKYLSADLHLPINTQYERDDFAPMVHEIMGLPQYDGKLVVVCWEHKVMTDIAKAFGIANPPQY